MLLRERRRSSERLGWWCSLVDRDREYLEETLVSVAPSTVTELDKRLGHTHSCVEYNDWST